MNNNSNYPSGAEYDSSAPWNEPDVTFCPYCQQREIDDYENEYDIDTAKENMIKICRSCFEIEMADEMRED